ncbi:MAG: YIP1 family protein [Bryobacteraceae bacterium]
MKIGGIVLFAAAVVLFAIGHGKEGLDASVCYVGAALAAALGGLLFVIAGRRKAIAPEPPPAVEPAPAGMSEFSRITGVFFDPKKTFEDIAKRPTWIVPVVLMIIAALAVSMTMSQRIGWERIVRHGMEANSRVQQMTPEQREQALTLGVKIASIMGYAGIVLVPVIYVIMAAVLLVMASGILSAGVRFKQVFAVVCYASLTGLISSILTIVVMFLKNPDELDIQNPLAFFNPGAFMDPNSGSKFVYSLATSLDLFSFWAILLMAVGLKAAAGKKLTFGSALFAVVLPWAVYVLGKSAWAGFTS